MSSARRASFVRDNDHRLLFNLARSLNKTVRELLTGTAGPLSMDEYVDWVALHNLEAKEHKAAEQKAGKARRGGGRRRR